MTPNFKRIFNDMINMKYPKKRLSCIAILAKKELTQLDILKLSELIHPERSKSRNQFNQQHKAYNKATIKSILDYQLRHNLTNTATANHFKLSKTTLHKWKQLDSTLF